MTNHEAPVSTKTIAQIERISDALFRRAAAIPGVGPEEEYGVGSGVNLEDAGSFVKLIKRKDSVHIFDGKAELLTGVHGDVRIYDFRNNPQSNKSRGIMLSRGNEYGGFTDIEPIKGEITENPSVDHTGTLQNYTGTRPLNDEQTRRFAAEFFTVVRDHLATAEANTSATR